MNECEVFFLRMSAEKAAGGRQVGTFNIIGYDL